MQMWQNRDQLYSLLFISLSVHRTRNVHRVDFAYQADY